MKLRWQRLSAETSSNCAAFLAAREEYCIAACERFLQWNEGPDHIWMASDTGGEVQGLIVLSSTGIVYPVFSDAKEAIYRKGLQRYLKLRKVRSVQARSDWADLSEDVLRQEGRQDPERIWYKLMRMDSVPAPEALQAGPSGLRIRQADASDAASLFPLQAAYEIEEVVPERSSFKPAASRLALNRLLDTRLVLVAEIDGLAVGKVNINAQSFTRDQIGGVFVRPEFRGHGIGTRLVAEICLQSREEKRGLSLFVKQQNAAAIRAYQRVGFSIYGDYRISYY